jgi:uncharacterized membrane protein
MGKGPEFVFAYLHVLGIVVLVGGHIWLGFFMTRAERTSTRRLVAESLPEVAGLMGIAVLVLFLTGLGRLLLWGDPGFIYLPTPYGWTLLTKLTIYAFVVLNGIWIEHVGIRRLLAATAEDEFSRRWIRLKQNVRLNFLLIMIMVALGETLSFSQA